MYCKCPAKRQMRCPVNAYPSVETDEPLTLVHKDETMATKDSKSREILLRIGKAIQFWRKLEGHDQHSFSNELKTVRSYVARLESGHTGISFARINKIAGILGISPYTLLTGIPLKEETAALLELYRDADYAITKKELEVLFSQRLAGKTLTRDYYLNILSFLRSHIYTR